MQEQYLNCFVIIGIIINLLRLNMDHFDLIVIGSGPAGEKAAVKAAYFGKKVALIEKESNLGGAGINTGTLPSKTLKQTALYLSGKYDKGMFGIEKKLERTYSIKEFLYRKNNVVDLQRKSTIDNLNSHKVKVLKGVAKFVDKNSVIIDGKTSISGDYIMVCTGSYPVHPDNIPFDFKRVHDSDSILEMKRFPRSICVIGAGVIGCEYATIFATMGIKTTIVNHSKEILNFLDKEISAELVSEMKKIGIDILFETSISKVKVPSSDEQDIVINLTNKNDLSVDMILFAAGRSGNIKDLELEKIGVEVGKRESVTVDKNYKTSIDNIYAVGDVIGFPALASTSMDQARVAVSNIFELNDLETVNSVLPYGIYTIPEVSMVGLTFEQAQSSEDEYVCGIAKCPNVVRGQILGTTYGFLKIIVRKKDGLLKGVHLIGPMATEMIHYGMILIIHKSNIWEIVSHVFNFPTMHGLYKHAAYDALGKIEGKVMKKF
jgi:NAD(P) transhydrogenase